MVNRCLECGDKIKEGDIVLEVKKARTHGLKILGQWIGTNSRDWVWRHIHLACVKYNHSNL